ncbi:AsmA-like C-terminal region-containing protein [Luteolibacter flavescens]|uniref:AsmA-like C-terminal region-containing protein n=1 Tax=Luteolibacter flavescens TaxID=1859460 RepID=A0ABT3FMM8_9BACT|nr:AsmA-like C-terminal region-containing protein [Luteolibacter flavescens]MCW1884825.1 AsmA-like C-terminal region-containing protein [Luteolibacter flavescens]
MSRRERRKKAAGAKGGSSNRWLVRGAVIAFGGAVALLGGGYIGLRSWLHGESFRHMLATEAGKAIGVTCEFSPFRWAGTSMTTDSFTASGEAIVQSINSEGLRVDVGLGGWWEGVWRIDEARARKIEVVIDTTAADRVKDLPPATVQPPPPPRGKKWYDSLVPDEVDLRKVDVGNSALKVITRSGPVSISGTSWKVTPDEAKGSYRAEGTDGTVKLPWEWAPPMNLGKARLRYHQDTVSLSAADFQVYQSGRLDLNGEMSVKGDGYVFNGHLRDVMCDEILPEDWKQRVAGKVDTEFTVESGKNGPIVEGSLTHANGVLTALPLLDSLAAYADTTRFRRIALEKGSLDYRWEDGAMTLKNIILSSEGLVRLEGSLQVDKQERIDGRFRLGLVPGILARIPGAETIVFAPGERGLLWTTLHISGTLEDPEEDLSQRLIAAAGMRMIEIIPETGEKVLKFTTQALDQDMQAQLKQSADTVIEQGKGVIEQGKGVIDEAAGVVKEVGGLLDIFGGKEEKKKEDE